MKKIALTGISGYIGTGLLEYLNRNDGVRKIVAIDITKPCIKSDKPKSCVRRGYPATVRRPIYEKRGGYRRAPCLDKYGQLRQN